MSKAPEYHKIIGGRLITSSRPVDNMVMNSEEEENADVLIKHQLIQNGDWT